MMGFFIFVHVIICILLGLTILMQAGKGGGLTEQFSSAENLFGAKTNTFLVKATTIIAVLFLLSCINLAYFSAQKEKSLLANKIATQSKKTTTQSLNEVLPSDVPATSSGLDVAEDAVQPETVEPSMNAVVAP